MAAVVQLEAQLPANASQASDISEIWKAAVGEYQRVTGTTLTPSAGANNVEGILSEIRDRETAFSRYRHDGSKVDKFRSLVRRGLVPIEHLAGIASQATKSVSSNLSHGNKKPKSNEL
jgi:hypothetical protein